MPLPDQGFYIGLDRIEKKRAEIPLPDLDFPPSEKTWKNLKKLEKRCWQKREGVVSYQSCPRDSGCDNEIPWMREQNRLEKFEKSSWQGKQDVVTYTSRLRGRREIRERPAGLAESWKSFKNLKKFLTKPKRCGKMNSRRCKAVCTL